MYKKTEETYFLNSEDKLVITFDNGNIKALINNTILINPDDLKLDVISSETISMLNGKKIEIINAIKLKCGVGE